MKKVMKKKTLFPKKKKPVIKTETVLKEEPEEITDIIPEASEEPAAETVEETPLQEPAQEETLTEAAETEEAAETSDDEGWAEYLKKEKTEEPEETQESWDEYLTRKRAGEDEKHEETWDEYEQKHHLQYDTADEKMPSDEPEETPVSENGENEPKNNKTGSSKRKVALILAAAIALSSVGGAFGYTSMKNRSQELEKAKFEAVAKKGKKVDIGSTLRQRTSKKVKKQKNIPAYSLAQIRGMDMSRKSGVTAADLRLVTSQGLVGLEQAFVNAENRYNVNALFLVAIASLESANGTICFKPNNMFGYGQKGYPSKEACIYDVASGLGNNYLRTGGSLYSGKTISDVNKRYASSSTWDDKVANNMYKYYQIISRRRRNALNSL